MRHGVHHAPLPPFISPSPPPSAGTSARPGKMAPSLFLALLLPCISMSVLFLIYICFLWFTTTRRTDNNNNNNNNYRESVKPVVRKGLSATELEKLPKVTGKELAAMGRSTECAVCLEEIEGEQPARLVPGCNHGFHLECANTWLYEHSVCPVCRAKLEPKLFEDKDQSRC